MITAITDAHVFDGEAVIEARTVVLEDDRIVQVGGRAPAAAQRLDAAGGTLVPGLIDAHTHTSAAALRLALEFGVTTELEMGGFSSRAERDRLSERDDVADVRSAGRPLTAPGGYPIPLFAGHDTGAHGGPTPDQFPRTATAEDARRLVRELAATGSDYIKLILEDGTVAGCPGLPALDTEAYTAGVAAAHETGLMALTHAQTVSTAREAVAAGTDGLVHLFVDGPHTVDLIEQIRVSGAFVTPCLTIVSSIMGRSGADFADDPRVAAKLDPAWTRTIRGAMATYPEGSFTDALASTKALVDAGVDVLAGTDVSVPAPHVGGLAHGASLHHELQLLVRAGLSEVAALRAATGLPARRFGLVDRGRIVEGRRADLVLVDGDPTTSIDDTLSIARVWRRGVALAPRPPST